MAEDKTALVDKIQKLLTKGDWNKALVELQKLNTLLDGKDLRVRLKMADILARTGRKDDAVCEYLLVAESYAQNGFTAQAIAVNKVIIKLDPLKDDVYKRLADLQAQCGLIPDIPGRGPSTAQIKKAEETGESSGKKRVPRTPLFSDLTGEELAYLSERVNDINIAAGSTVFKEGDPGDSILIISFGEVKILAKNSKGEEVDVARLKEGEFFGEFGYFSNSRRQASAVAVVDSELLELTRDILLDIGQKHPRINQVLLSFYKQRVADKVMATSDLFRHIDKKERTEILHKLTLQTFEPGTLIIQEGCPGDYLYLIKSGKADVTTWRDEQEMLLATIKEGEFFGEISLVTGAARTASVRARTLVETLRLSKADLEDVASKHPKIKKVIDDIIRKRVQDTIRVVTDMNEIWKSGLV